MADSVWCSSRRCSCVERALAPAPEGQAAGAGRRGPEGSAPGLPHAAEATTIAPTLKVRANVSGCDAVRGIEIYNDKRFLISFDTPRRCRWTSSCRRACSASSTNRWGSRAAQPEGARICVDGRENRSTGLGLSFFPVEGVIPPVAPNSTALPDSFVARAAWGAPHHLHRLRGDSSRHRAGAVRHDGQRGERQHESARGHRLHLQLGDQRQEPGHRAALADRAGGRGVRVRLAARESAEHHRLPEAVIPMMGVGPDGDAA